MRPTLASQRNEERVGPASIKGNKPSRISFFLPEDKGDPTMPKNGKIPTHDISRKDTANMNSMEFNETLTPRVGPALGEPLNPKGGHSSFRCPYFQRGEAWENAKIANRLSCRACQTHNVNCDS